MPFQGFWLNEPRARELFVSLLTLAIVSTFIFGLRVWARLNLKAWGGVDDYLMLAAVAMFWAQPIIVPFSGFGIKDDRLSVEERVNGLRWNFVVGILYTINTTLVKCSIACHMLRIARERIHHRIFHGVIIITSIACLFRILAILISCKPIEENWSYHEQPDYGPSYRRPRNSCALVDLLKSASYAFIAVIVLTDVICAVVPAVIIYKLHLGWRQKVLVGVMLALGAFASIATLIRIKFPVVFSNVQMKNFFDQVANWVFFSNLEVALGIIAACIATTRPLWKYVRYLGIPIRRTPDGSSTQLVNTFSLQQLESRSNDQLKEQGAAASIENASMDSGVQMFPAAPPAARINRTPNGHFYMPMSDESIDRAY